MSSNSRRDKAAAARNAAQAGERRRERTVRIVGAATVVAVVVAIIGVAVFARSQEGSVAGVTVVEPDPTAAIPAGVFAADSEWPFGVPYGTGSDSVPVLEVWEDFQCPACGSLEQANGDGIKELAEQGVVRLIYRPTHFLDRNLGNDSSNRAIAAWGCAIDAGKTAEFHRTVFANQPEEGVGYTQEQLIAFGEQSGITGADLETFTACVNDETYRAWAANSTEEFYNAQVPGTPLGKINGVDIENTVLADKAALLAAITEAATQ